MMKSCERIKCTDRFGEEFEIAACSEGDSSCLMDMYDTFSPRPASQGLPPEDPETCARWVRGLMETGENLVAWRGRNAVGHAALMSDGKGETAEFVIFVHQSFRNLGIGTELTRVCIERARQLGFKSVWLTVALSNFIAIRLYRKLCFEYCDMDNCERTMALRL
jgi:GNAT superfamily N-acetyltransferase